MEDVGPARIEYNGAILVCDEPVHNVGTQWIGPAIDHEFVLRNDGETVASIEVKYMVCCSHAPCYATIGPGETVRIPIHLDSCKFRGRFEKSIRVRFVPSSERVKDNPGCIRRPFESACEAAP